MKTIDLLKVKSKVIPVFFACDDNFVKYMLVCMKSLIEHTTPTYEYRLHVLHTNISIENQQLVKDLETENCTIFFHDVAKQLKQVEKKLSLRDYYSNTTYFRLFIPDMFPEYNKVAYIDCDTIVLHDIADFYQHRLGENYIGAVRDQLIVQSELFGDYAEKVLGISRMSYFNAGVVLINCHLFREKNVLKQFIELLSTYSFVVAQDQDYLNTICKDHVLWLNDRWNIQMGGQVPWAEDSFCLVHYNLSNKPWHYRDCRYGDYFWRYAAKTAKYNELLDILNHCNEENRKHDDSSSQHLVQLAVAEINNESNYRNLFGDPNDPSLHRIEILNKIKQYEREGRFDEDVEDDPPGRELMPNEVDYLKKSLRSRMRAKHSLKIARWFLNYMIRKQQIIIKDIVGIEHYRGLTSGAVITCNHFNPFDTFAMHIAYDHAHQRRRKLFRVIKEGNYTSFPGFYGYLMRNCNTLPLSSNKETMKKFIKATDKILQAGHFILIYPEQSMWWNYRKPKPLKKGGFTIAAKNKVPVLPCFITMNDSDVTDSDGFPVQEYTIHIAPPIYPDKNLKQGANAEAMMAKNYEVWKHIYEETYGIPLTYTCDEHD